MVEAPEAQQDSSKQHEEDDETPEITLETVTDVFGFPLEEVFKDGIKYYKAQERSGDLHVEYPVRLQFMALAKQIRNGPFKNELANAGWFDLVGNDANKEWQKLGDLSREEAMLEFVRLLDVVCPTFKPHINERAAIETSKAVLERRRDSNNTVNNVTYNHLINGNAENSEVLKKYEEQRRQIQEALNKATYHQFLAYAQQTHPGDPEKQEQLIQQLREQHYEQYMSQVYARQAEAQAASIQNLGLNDNPIPQPQLPPLQQQQNPQNQRQKSPGEESSDSEAGIKPRDSYMQEGLERPRTPKDDDDESESEIEADEVPSNPKIAPANLWNRKDITEFKAQIKKEGPEGIIKVGHGETVTVRVPTHEEGTCLFWEFATDYYDIGFGVYFEWSISETSEVSVHVSESSDEEYDEEAESSAAAPIPTGDVESAGAMKKPRDPNKPAVDEIIPVYRRDCHEEVFAGSHQYPARGVYLLKFDNSYSLWRSKTLYYRVYYSK
jgi:acyl-CoA-binding protein